MKKMRLIALIFILALIYVQCAFAAPSASGPDSYGGWQASWSPDGKHIAFVSGLPHASSGVWIANADGTNERQLTKLGGHGPVWSSDSRQIIFESDRGQGMRYYSVSITGAAGEKAIDLLPVGAIHPVWSPDGKQVIYALVQDGKQKVYIQSVATGEKSEVKMDITIKDYCWSPDGKRLAVVSGEYVGNSLWLYDISTAKVKNIYHGYCSSPAFSPDGTTLAFATPLGKNQHRLFIVLPDKTQDLRSGVTEFDGESISWAPNGKKLLYASTIADKPAKLWTIDNNGRNMLAFKQTYDWVANPQYSPDGKMILFEAVEKGSFSSNIFVCRADGTNPKKITNTCNLYWQSQWGPTGKLIAMSSVGSRGEMLLIDPDKGTNQLINLFKLQRAGKLGWSPVGDKFAIVQQGDVTIFPAAPKARLNNPLISSPFPTSIAWSADGKKVFFSAKRENGLGISAITLDEKEVTPLTQKDTAPVPPGYIPPAETTTTPSDDKTKPVPGGGETSTETKPEAEKVVQPKPVIDVFPALSWDGKTIAFVRGREIWAIDSTGENERKIVAPEMTESDVLSHPVWSKDGGSILFQLYRQPSTGLQYELWTVNADGSNLKQLYQHKVDSEFDVYSEDSTNPAAYSPDGKSVIFTTAISGMPQIFQLDIATGKAKQLTNTGGTFPSLSADGKRLAYTSFEGNRETIKILDLATGKSRALKLDK